MEDKDESLLQKAHDIVVNRSEEKERMYGDFKEGMIRATKIFEGMTGLDFKPEYMYKALIALKLSRESFNHKDDNIIDAMGYLEGLDDYLKSIENK